MQKRAKMGHMKQSSPRIVIEQLTSFSPESAEDIRSLAKKLGDNFQPLTDQDLKDMLTSPTTYVFVARDKEVDKIIGMATLVIYRIPYLKKAYLDDFVVLDEYQGKGIGSDLLKAVLNKAKTEGAAYIEFTSNPKRVGANKFYQKFGFQKRDTNVYRHDFDHEKAE